MTNPNEPAFSRAAFYHPDCGSVPAQEGLTKREYFAAMAMQGLLASGNKFTRATIAVDSVQMADALIAMLYQPKP